MATITQIRTDPSGRNGELLCRNCKRLGSTHVWFAPHHCRAYEDESILPTTFEAVCVVQLPPLPFPKKK